MKKIIIPVTILLILNLFNFAIMGQENKKLPVLIDLGAKKCIPCKQMAPILDELKANYVGILDVQFIDVWQQENVAQAEKYGIESIPTQIFLSPEGKELFRHVGYFSKEEILSKWKELGFDLKPNDLK